MNELNLKEMRKSKRLTQKGLAALLDVHVNTVINWEKNGEIPESKIPGIITSIRNYKPNSQRSHYLIPDESDTTSKLAEPNQNLTYRNSTKTTKTTIIPSTARSLFTSPDYLRFTELEEITSPVTGADFATTLSNDGLGKEFPDGSTIFFKKVDPEIYLEWSELYAISSPNGLLIRRIFPGDSPEKISCLKTPEDTNPITLDRISADLTYWKAIAILTVK